MCVIVVNIKLQKKKKKNKVGVVYTILTICMALTIFNQCAVKLMR